MAEVFRALDQPPAGAARAVVIKRMLPALAADRQCRHMFEDEAELGLRIRHDNVVQVLSSGTDGSIPYIVLEYVFGVDLWRVARHLTRTGSKLRLPVAMYIVTEMLNGLAAVHAVTDGQGRPAGIVHRDVSPSNVFLSVHGDVKLGDLGIAGATMRETHPHAPRNTRAKGKLGYLAPEQVAGQPSDQRADVFAAGVIAAELILGRPLFTGGGEIGILLAIRDGDVRAFREAAAELPPALGLALLGALERSPDVRTESASELRDRLLPFVDEDVGAVRRELGELVARVLSADQEPTDRRALAKTVERDAESWELETPGITQDGRLRIPSDTGELITVDGPEEIDRATYAVRASDGRELGLFKYAGLIEAIATGRIGPADEIAVDGADPLPLLAFPELVRHLPPSSRTPTMRRRARMVETNELHDLARGGMLRVLGRALVDRDTGLLLCEHGEIRKEIYLEEGRPVFVASNLASDLFGAYLVARGVIDRAELDMALAVMPRFEGRLGETLSALGLVEPVHLVRHLEAQVRERLLDTFTWTRGRAAFYGGVEAPEGRVPIELDPFEILDSGAALRITAGLEDERFAGRGPDSALVTSPAADDLLRADPPADLALLLASLDSPQPLSRLEGMLVGGPGGGPARVRRLVAFLLAIEAVRWVG